MRFVRRPWTESTVLVDADPDIQAMVDAVSRDIMHIPMLDLQGLDSRHSEENGGYLASHYIRNTLRAQGYDNVSFHDYDEWNDNVVCIKEGTTRRDEYVVTGAHYDSISRDGGSAPGADDNATGTVGVMEAARVVAGYEFERTVIFIAFSGEEQGLVGSESWASEAAAAGLNIVAMINLDMLCYLAPDDAEDLDIISDPLMCICGTWRSKPSKLTCRSWLL
jgi:acetylornithine deacetylase/succinyl-diaminopimelate desuccinylase-like protein